MPFRIVGYDGAAYRSQLQQERKKMLPVVTIVLYFGTDRHWNSSKKIKQLMEIPRCLDTYVNDYQMHVFEVAWLTEEQISHFRSDFKVVANFFVQKRKNKVSSNNTKWDRSSASGSNASHCEGVGMLGDITAADEIYIVTGRTDMRKSIDGLCAVVEDQLHMDPRRSALYLFCGKRCDRIKALLWESDGFVLLYKRMEVQGRFRWPRNQLEVKQLTWQQFDWLMSGLEIEQPKAFKPTE